MTLPLPDWMPWWLQLAIVAAALLLILTYILLPFSVFGLKSRLDAIEARLDSMQTDLRSLVQRLPDATQGPYDPPAVLPVPRPVQEPRSPTLRAAARLGDAARERAEPRLNQR